MKQIKTALRAAMKDIDRDEFVPTFKRGDKFIVPHAANNDNIIGNGDHCHVRMTIDRLNKLKPISLDRTAGVCWKQEIAATATSRWREVSGQEQQERMHATERQ